MLTELCLEHKLSFFEESLEVLGQQLECALSKRKKIEFVDLKLPYKWKTKQKDHSFLRKNGTIKELLSLEEKPALSVLFLHLLHSFAIL